LLDNRTHQSVDLPPGFLDRLLDEIDRPEFVGVLLGGSYARGNATRYSDIDLAPLVDLPEQAPRKSLMYREGFLVSVSPKSIAGIRADMLKPERAIWVVPGIAECRVLRNKTGAASALLDDLQAFRWEPLQDAANLYAGRLLMLASEGAHKLLSEMQKGDEQALLYAAAKMVAWLTEVMAVGRGVLVKSDSLYYAQVQEAAGPQWPRLHRAALGVEGGSAEARCLAALELYIETARLLTPVMQPEHLAVVEQTVALATQATHYRA
jgi:predicted nucleotidyltransferase